MAKCAGPPSVVPYPIIDVAPARGSVPRSLAPRLGDLVASARQDSCQGSSLKIDDSFRKERGARENNIGILVGPRNNIDHRDDDHVGSNCVYCH